MKITKITLAIALCIVMMAAGSSMIFAADNSEKDRSLPETPQLYLTLTSSNGETQSIRAMQSSTNWRTDTVGFSSQGTNLWDMNNTGNLPEETIYLFDAYGEIELYFTKYPPDSIEVLRWTSTHVMGDFGINDDINNDAKIIRMHGNSFRIMNYDGHDYIYQVFAQWGDNNNSIYYFRTLGKPIAVPETETPSSWAQEQVNAAIAANLVPQNLQSNYTQAITRAEFCALAVALYETLRGEITGRTTFADTNDINVEKMAYIGVVSGVGNNRFDPNEPLTREQAAVMLSRLADAIGHPFPTQAATFADNDSISSWAIESVGEVQAAGIIDGVGDNRFAPEQPYTRGQSIVTVLRMFNEFNIPTTEVPITDPSFEVGKVTIISNGVEYEPYVHFAHGAMRIPATENEPELIMSVSGTPRQLERIFETLPVIQYADDFQIVIDGEDARSITYSLYNDNFELIVDGHIEDLSFPEEGVYILVIHIVWSYQDQGSEFTRNDYIFKIEK